MWWFGRQLSWIPGRGWKIPFYLSGVQSLSPLPVSEEHGCKGPEFASWVTACLVSPNFAWHALNHLQKNNAPTNLHCDKNLDHNCEHTFVSILVFNFDQHFDIYNFDHGHHLVTILIKVLSVINVVYSSDNLYLIRLSPKITFFCTISYLHHLYFNFSCTIL